jgi:type IV secretory pathway VirB2 component (pilin)
MSFLRIKFASLILVSLLPVLLVLATPSYVGAQTNSNTKSSSTTNDAGSCPDGFTTKGPLCIPKNPFGDDDGVAGKGSVGELATTIISILLGLSGIVAVIMIIIGGYQVMTARGNETQQTNGRKTLINALIGLAIVIVSYAVVQAVANYLTNTKT